MFEALCFLTGDKWHGISYAGGGLNTHHGFESCDARVDYSNKDEIYPDTLQQLGMKAPKNYMIGSKKEMWA
eukprot:CAMPEP_0181292506 /NCGR_PEP_ID=MMETSP1101-20121128/2541_1 /TAXON_ID=46948 /ORGANISM="Rhodomonas abbreviata, Strain Caron Lab Isolate" /LENGTH=70 /DNA_ID=CAMNT_0023396977 /DNA_START=68 /DNA_END=280 /DNA_ORIENTATION=+